MCLKTIDKKEITDKIKNSIPEEGITVYKLVRISNYGIKDGRYCPLYQRTYIPFEKGMNEADIRGMIEESRRDPKTCQRYTYQSGFHFWLKKENAEKYREFVHRVGDFDREEVTVIECKIKKEWITNTGMHVKDNNRYARTIVTNEAIFPKFEDKNE